MTTSAPTSMSLLGTLPKQSIDARALVQITKNPNCERLRAIVFSGTGTDQVMMQIFDPAYAQHQSPLAMAKGVMFENFICGNGASPLLGALQQASQLSPTDVEVLHVEKAVLAYPNNQKLAAAMALTTDVLKKRACGDRQVPAVVLQAALRVDLGNGEYAVVRPDMLIARAGAPIYCVGEIKGYCYMRDLTDPNDVAQAVQQMGVYHASLSMTMTRLGIVHPVPQRGVMVMHKPGGLSPIAHVQDIGGASSNTLRALGRRSATLNNVVNRLGVGVSLDSEPAIRSIPACYSGKCRAVCALHTICRDEAQAAGDPALLGVGVASLLKGAGCTIDRAIALSRGAPSMTLEESQLQSVLFNAENEWKGAA